ncbi:MAG: glycosyltransferase family 4 protein [Bacteroidota bacterium]
MKILVLSKKFPFPLKDGESQAIHGLCKSLHELDCQVSLLAMNTSKHYYSEKTLPEGMDHFDQVRTVVVDNQLKIGSALSNLVRNTSYHISRFDNDDYRQALRRWLKRESFDIIQLETVYLAPYLNTIRRHTDAPVVMRAHNVEHEIWERRFQNLSFGPKRWYLKRLTKQLARYEREQLNQYDLLLPITKRDEERFRKLGYKGKSHVLPLGLDADKITLDFNSYHRDPSIHFIGSLDWTPNIEGLQWFLNKAWPAIHKKFPKLQFHIAGRNMPHAIKMLDMSQVFVHGEVDDAQAFVSQHSISIVPLLSGSGMRAKILEAMALGRTVISTSIGLEGIQAEHRRHLLIADTPQQFLEAIEHCYRQGSELEQLGRSAQKLFEKKYNRKKLAEKLVKTYNKLIDEQKSLSLSKEEMDSRNGEFQKNLISLTDH